MVFVNSSNPISMKIVLYIASHIDTSFSLKLEGYTKCYVFLCCKNQGAVLIQISGSAGQSPVGGGAAYHVPD